MSDEILLLKEKLADEMQRRAFVQEELRKSKEELSLASSIIHDINNLLMVVHFASKQLLDQIPTDDPKRQVLTAIQEARKQATNLTRKVPAAPAKASAENLSVDLNALIQGWERLFKRIIKGNVIVNLNLAADRATIDAPLEVVDWIVLKLILKAIGSIPDGGWVTIETHHELISATDAIRNRSAQPGSYIRLTISDTGCGPSESNSAPEEIMDDAFDRPAAIIETVERIVIQHGGWIEAAYSPDAGTKVQIGLPLQSSTGETMVDQFESLRELRGTESILLVEDEDVIRRFVKQTLEQHGYQVADAHDQNSALDVANQLQTVELLLTDLVLPGASGRTIAENLRQQNSELPVIYISGLATDDAHIAGPLDTNTSFLQKPFQTSDLLVMIRSLLDASR